MPWCWEDLANAIILQAVKDFRKACRRVYRKADDREAEKVVREVSWFFRSKYFSLLTTLDGPALLDRLTKEVRNEQKRPA